MEGFTLGQKWLATLTLLSFGHLAHLYCLCHVSVECLPIGHVATATDSLYLYRNVFLQNAFLSLAQISKHGLFQLHILLLTYLFL